MRRLLSANFARLRKNRLFWVAAALLAALSAFTMAMNVSTAWAWEEYGEKLYFDECYFMLSPFIGLFITVTAVLFLSVDYGDGTIRNKITAGHTRAEIYSANLLTCVFISAVFDAVWLAFGLVGLPFMECGRGLGEILLYALVTLLFSVTAGAVAALVGMLISGRAGSAVTALLLFLGLLMLSSAIVIQLGEPETVQYMTMTENGMEMVGPIANPQYIGGALRVALELVVNALPSGQAVMLSNMELAHPVLAVSLSVFLTAVVSACGMFAFGRKDIR